MSKDHLWRPIIIDEKETRYVINDDGEIFNKYTGNKLTKYISDGFVKVSLKPTLDSHNKSFNVAKLMLLAFYNEESSDDNIIFFKDNNRENVSLSNIEYVSNEEYNVLIRRFIFDMLPSGNYILKDGNWNAEYWKELAYDGFRYSKYMISNYGRIMNVRSGGYLHSNPDCNGYPICSIKMDGNGKTFSMNILIHIAVAQNFVDNPDPSKFTIVHHKDDDKSNYYFKNLEWTTSSLNRMYALESGLGLSGEKHPFASITESQAHDICKMLADGEKISNIVKTVNTTRSVVRHIKDGTSWKNVSKQYDFSNTYDSHHILNNQDKIMELISGGLSCQEISKLVKISQTSYNILKHRVENKSGIIGKRKNSKETIIRKLQSHGLTKYDIEQITGFTIDK